MTKKITLVHGRFQPLHNGHLEDYIMKAVEISNCDYLYVGITNADESHIKPSVSNTERSKPQNNPLNYVERLEMIKLALIERGLSREKFEIIPFPINRKDLLPSYHINNVKYYLTIFDQWGKDKFADLISLYGEENVEEIPTEKDDNNRIKATDIRNKMKESKEWENLVPKSVANYLKDNKLVEKIIKLR